MSLRATFIVKCNLENELNEAYNFNDNFCSSVSIIFGAVTMVSGMLGVPLGALLSTFLREKFPRADPIICGTGLILSSFFIFATFFFARTNIFMGFAFVFLGEVALNLNWSIVADILLVSNNLFYICQERLLPDC
jgi:hypothetical protein